MEIAYSPCPNDTFIFGYWALGLLPNAPKIAPIYADVQALNESAKNAIYPVTKLSFSCLAEVLDDYVLLPSGAALGKGCGPKLVAKNKYSIDEISNLRVAIPGRNTTAALLAKHFLPQAKETVYCSFENILSTLEQGKADLGVIIHETRFTFEKEGYQEIVDLGELWEQKYMLPIPLGGIAAKRSLGEEKINEISACIERSVKAAFADPSPLQDYILSYSQEKDPRVIQKHIDMFVNKESIKVSAQAEEGIQKLLEIAGTL
jgi:1,4-dihydroxy-6-naphthoate synthase